MNYDVQISFTAPWLKVIFEELFVKKLDKPLQLKILLKNVKEEKSVKYYISTSRWMFITFYDRFFENKFQKEAYDEFVGFMDNFFQHQFIINAVLSSQYFIKFVYRPKKGFKLIFLFEGTTKTNFLKQVFVAALHVADAYRNRDEVLIKEIKRVSKFQFKEVFYRWQYNKWKIIDLLYEAGNKHNLNHDELNDVCDIRLCKANVLINRSNLTNALKTNPARRLEVNRREIFRLKFNDVGLYSALAQKNLVKAKEIFDSKRDLFMSYSLSKETLMELLDYYELIASSIIFAFSSIEALVNIAIPENYVHIKRETNNESGRSHNVKYHKSDIQRWFNLEEKMNTILPAALQTPKLENEKWWSNYNQLVKLRNKIIHSTESGAAEKYSKLLEKNVFKIVESHVEIIKFFGKWASDNKHPLINEIPNGFGYDDIYPTLVDEKFFNDVRRDLENPYS